MNGYLKSEVYRLKKKKLNFIIIPILILLIILLAVILEYFATVEPSFPYGNTLFYYSNVFSMSNFVLLIVCLLATYLLGKDRQLIPVSIALGIERKKIYTNKFIVSFVHFLINIFLLAAAVYLSGTFLITQDSASTAADFLFSSLNLLPVLISAFIMCYVTSIILDNEITGIITVFIFYKALALVSFGLTKQFNQLEEVAKFLPANAFSDVMNNFLSGTVQFEIYYWIVNLFLSLLILWIGYKAIERKDYI